MEDDIRKMLEENLQLSRETHAMMKKIRRSMATRTVISFIYLFLVVAPLIFAVIYLPPIIKTYWQQYQELLAPLQSTDSAPSVNSKETKSPTWQEILNYAKSIQAIPQK